MFHCHKRVLPTDISFFIVDVINSILCQDFEDRIIFVREFVFDILKIRVFCPARLETVVIYNRIIAVLKCVDGMIKFG